MLASACSTATPPANATETQPASTAAARETITVPLTLYRLTDTDGSGLGSARTIEELEIIAGRMDDIWSQADITFDPLVVRDLEVPSDVLAPIVQSGNIDALTEAFQTSIEVPDPGVINGFYLSEAFGVNGFAPSGTRVFFVVDEPTVPDERVSSHEVGHLFGLHHDPTDPSRLMFSGTDGTTIEPDEQAVARYVARGINNGQR